MPQPKRDFIRKTKGGKFGVYSEAGKLIAEHSTRGKALKQLRAIEASKARDAWGIDAKARMGALELPGATEQEYLGADALDAFTPKTSRMLEDPLSRHELPMRRSNPHHAPDPFTEHPEGQGDPDLASPVQLEKRYLQVEEPPGGPAVDALDPMPRPTDDKLAVKAGGKQIEKQEHAKENLATERAEQEAGVEGHGPGNLGDALDAYERVKKGDQPGRPAREEYRAPFAPGGNGDPAPNPSKQQTIGSTASITIAGGSEFPAGEHDLANQEHDEGDPNQYEMLSTARKAPDLNEATEPGYGEVSSTAAPKKRPGSISQASPSAAWRDPAGDDDWLKAIGAIPNNDPVPAGPGTGGSVL